MDFRHLRAFIAVAEELHFSRAAARLNIEQSPVSRAIKELEEEIGTPLFQRNRRGTRLTRAGHVFLQDIRKVFDALEFAIGNAKAIASGFNGSLNIAVSDGVLEQRLSILLARCREDEPEIQIRLSEVPFSRQLSGLHTGIFDAGIARSHNVGKGIVAEAIWTDPLVVVVPAKHHLLLTRQSNRF